MKRTSILINNFNNARFLRTCVDSALAQTQRAAEVIVYDDGSSDDSLTVLASYRKRIRVLCGRRGVGEPWDNQAAAIAAAFRECTGEFIYLLDADDAFAAGKLAAYGAAFARSESVIMVQAPMWKIDVDGRIVGLERDWRRHADDYLSHIYATHEVNIYYPTSALAFRRSYLERRLPLDVSDGLPMWPDARLGLIAPHFGDIATLSNPYTFWRRHPRSHTMARKTSVYEQVRMNRIFYNAFCARRGLPGVRGWRSAQHRRRWLRHICPAALLKLYQWKRRAAVAEIDPSRVGRRSPPQRQPEKITSGDE